MSAYGGLWDADPERCCAAFQLGACVHTEAAASAEDEMQAERDAERAADLLARDQACFADLMATIDLLTPCARCGSCAHEASECTAVAYADGYRDDEEPF